MLNFINVLEMFFSFFLKKSWLLLKMIFSYISLQTTSYFFFFWFKFLFKIIFFLAIFSFVF